MMPPGLLVSQKLAVVRVGTLPRLVSVLAVGEADVVVGWLLLAGGAMCLCPSGPWQELTQLLPLLEPLQGSLQCSHGGNGLAAGALSVPHVPAGVGVLGQLTCIQPLDLL